MQSNASLLSLGKALRWKPRRSKAASEETACDARVTYQFIKKPMTTGTTTIAMTVIPTTHGGEEIRFARDMVELFEPLRKSAPVAADTKTDNPIRIAI